VGTTVVANWWKVEFLIHESSFQDPPIAEDFGDSVDALMFLTVRATEKINSKPRIFSFNLPVRLRVYYSNQTTEADSEGENYRVFSANEGEVIFTTMRFVQSFDNVINLFAILASARITNVDYEELANLFITGSNLNGSNLGVSRVLVEAMISDMARWTKDRSVPLRLALSQGKAKPEDFSFVKLKDLPRLNSAYAGIGFEDIQLAVQTGVRQTMQKVPQRISPIEEVLKY
jgi:hypothetical protein